MSSCDPRSAPRHAFRAGLFALGAAFALTACTIQPVYGPQPTSSGAAVTSAISRISIDPVNDRVGQVVRNKLIFTLAGGSETSDPIYRMHISVGSSEIALGVGLATSTTYSVTVAVTYEVTKVGSPDIVLRSTSRASASYDRVNSAFANTRAKIDAENRAAATVADEVRIRVAAGLATKA